MTLRGRWIERGLAVVLFGYAILEFRQRGEANTWRWMAPVPLSLAAAAASPLALGWMRARTVLVAPLALGVPAVYALVWGTPESGPAVLSLIWVSFLIGLHLGPYRWALLAGLAANMACVEVGMPGRTEWTDYIFIAALVLLPLGVARVVVHRQQLADELRRAQPLIAQAVVVDERARIARELHDVVAHSVSVMVIQSVAGQRLVRRDPDQAEEAMRTVEATGKDALGELRRLLGVLRAGEDAGLGLEPQPGLGDLGALVERARESGVTVAVDIDGDVPLTPGVDLAAYRIVQEALTNVIRHAGASTARVRVRRGRDAVDIEVLDEGRGGPRVNGHGSGHGLAGMRERAALYGGELEAGPRAGGGYRVHARLPA